MIRIGIDIGGTFTDFAAWTGRETFENILSHKSPSTPPDFAEGVKDGLRAILPQIPRAPGEPVLIVHGMTVGTNTVIERSGADLGLLVTEGFRDILRLGRLRVLKPFDLWSTRSTPLVPRKFVYEIPERMMAGGRVHTAVDLDACVAAARAAKDAGRTGIVIAFLHSYSNPAHEVAARAAILDAMPDMDVVLSSEVWPQESEYERATLAVLNAFVKPVMSSYLAEVEDFLHREVPEARLFVAKSNGGVMSAAAARNFPVHTLLSGPAAGVTATRFLGQITGHDGLLTMDMGGTSTDMSLVSNGRSITSSSAEVGEFPLNLPVTTIEAMGAGGGSIIWADKDVLRVGPRSSGARPGPACYGRGGTLPTLSDAYLLCGYLGDSLVGGDLVLDRAAATAAFAPLSDALGIPPVEVAMHAITVATATMLARALPFLARLGEDPQRLSLVLFGGAGSIHGPLLAQEMGIDRILVPPTPSVFCAAGCLVAPVTHDAVRSVHGPVDIAETFAELESEARDWLDGQIDTGWLTGVEIEHYASIRYAGQFFPIDVALDGPLSRAAAEAAFHAEHQRIYTHSDPSTPVEIVELRLRLIGTLATPAGRMGDITAPPAAPAAVPHGVRTLRLDATTEIRASLYHRHSLAAGARLRGPALVEQSDTTILVPPEFSASVGPSGELVLEREAGK